MHKQEAQIWWTSKIIILAFDSFRNKASESLAEVFLLSGAVGKVCFHELFYMLIWELREVTGPCWGFTIDTIDSPCWVPSVCWARSSLHVKCSPTVPVPTIFREGCNVDAHRQLNFTITGKTGEIRTQRGSTRARVLSYLHCWKLCPPRIWWEPTNTLQGPSPGLGQEKWDCPGTARMLESTKEERICLAAVQCRGHAQGCPSSRRGIYSAGCIKPVQLS